MYIYAIENDFRDFSPENLPHKSGPADGDGRNRPSAGIFGGPGLSRKKGGPRAVPALLRRLPREPAAAGVFFLWGNSGDRPLFRPPICSG
ncbi:MAG TPA: hypothetical protein DC013_07455 [Ruminococcaceae bacterium]|nr:hypothetical protein [Oscillospiraceae bacterium]